MNEVKLRGNLGNDPEMRTTANGTSVTNTRIATHERFNDKKSGKKVENTTWTRLVFFGKLAEIVHKFCRKGSYCMVDMGMLQNRKWTDKEGIKRYTTEVVVSKFKIFDKKVSTSYYADTDTPDDYVPTPMGDDVPF